MNIIINLLKQKNTYLTRFKRLSICEHRRIQNGDFSRLDAFYHNRQVLLEAIESLDKELMQHKSIPVSEKDKKTIIKLLHEKRAIIMSILDKDLCIHSYFNEWEQSMMKNQIA